MGGAPQRPRLFLATYGRTQGGGLQCPNSSYSLAILVVDLPSGKLTKTCPRHLGVGDPPYTLTETGGKLVFFGGDTYVVGNPLRDRASLVGRSLYYVPSASPGRVWLVHPGTHRLSASEVSLSGRVIVPPGPSRPCAGPVMGAVRDGPICEDSHRVEVYDPRTGRTILSLPGSLVATHGDLAAVVRGLTLIVRNVRTLTATTVGSGEGFQFQVGTGAFSPDGSKLAVPVQGVAWPRSKTTLAVVNVRNGSTRLIPHSERRSGIAWSPSGHRLFFVGTSNRVMSYRLGDDGPKPVSASLGRLRVFGIAAGSTGRSVKRQAHSPAAPLGDTRSARGYGSVWKLNPSASSVTRTDVSTGVRQARIHLSLPQPLVDRDRAFVPFSIALGQRAAWVSTARGYLARISPRSNRVTQLLRIPKESSGIVAVKSGALWVSETLRGVLRIDPKTNHRSWVSVPVGRHELLSVGFVTGHGGVLAAHGEIARPSFSGGYVLTGQGATALIDADTGRVIRINR